MYVFMYVYICVCVYDVIDYVFDINCLRIYVFAYTLMHFVDQRMNYLCMYACSYVCDYVFMHVIIYCVFAMHSLWNYV